MLIILVFVYSEYISKKNDNIAARRFCAVLVAVLYTNVAI